MHDGMKLEETHIYYRPKRCHTSSGGGGIARVVCMQTCREGAGGHHKMADRSWHVRKVVYADSTKTIICAWA